MKRGKKKTPTVPAVVVKVISSGNEHSCLECEMRVDGRLVYSGDGDGALGWLHGFAGSDGAGIIFDVA